VRLGSSAFFVRFDRVMSVESAAQGVWLACYIEQRAFQREEGNRAFTENTVSSACSGAPAATALLSTARKLSACSWKEVVVRSADDVFPAQVQRFSYLH